jgi:UrcA family protein
MSRKSTSNRGRFVLGAATLACALLCGSVAAKDHAVTVSIHVNSKGLDPRQPADAQTLYTRIENAAWIACTRGNRADLVPVDDTNGCYRRALGNAIRSAGTPVLTQIYLRTHTVHEATALGIEVPAQMAAK